MNSTLDKRLRKVERRRRTLQTENDALIEEMLSAFMVVFKMMHGREPTAAEIEEERISLIHRKPSNLSETINELEKMVYTKE